MCLKATFYFQFRLKPDVFKDFHKSMPFIICKKPKSSIEKFKIKEMNMRSLFMILLFVSTYCYSQNIHYNLSNHKAYKMPIAKMANPDQAKDISKTLEKNVFCDLIWVNFKNGEIYFITSEELRKAKIFELINNTYNVTCSDFEEIVIDNDLFLNIYAQKSEISFESINKQIPNYIYTGNQEKSEMLYQTAKEIWVNKYPYQYKSIYSAEGKNLENIPEHYPVFVNTGNPDYDNSVFDQAKKEWIKQYPEEYSKMSGETYPVKNNKENK